MASQEGGEDSKERVLPNLQDSNETDNLEDRTGGGGRNWLKI